MDFRKEKSLTPFEEVLFRPFIDELVKIMTKCLKEELNQYNNITPYPKNFTSSNVECKQ